MESEALDRLYKEGYVCVTKCYSFKEKFSIRCPQGHVTDNTLNSLNESLKRNICVCPECRRLKNRERLRLNIKSLLDKKGYTLVSENVQYGKKVEYICDKGHLASSAIPNLMNGKGCPMCFDETLIKHATIVKRLSKENYSVLDLDVNGSKTRFQCKCPEGHVYTTTYDSWYNSGNRCPHCAGNFPLTKEELVGRFEQQGYTLVSGYKNAGTPVALVCPNNHLYYVSWNNWSTKGHRCPKCSLVGVSVTEKEVLDFVRSIVDLKVVENDRTILEGRELDIVIPELKLAIEFCGLYWHGELKGKDKNYHKSKLLSCKEKGYKLIIIFEDEWLTKREIVESRLKSYINSTGMERVHARKCVIKEIDGSTSKQFCINNHLQGYGAGACIKLGAFYNDILVAIMTFSKPSLAKGQKFTEKGVYELHRFCPKTNYIIPGIASKLLKHFERNYDWSCLFSFADCRWSSGNLYSKLGFNLHSTTAPNYWYFTDSVKRIHRFMLRKTKKDDQNKTEWENRVEQGYDRIWDCGNLKYIKYKQ